MQSFQDSNDEILIINGSDELRIPKSLFVTWEPNYSLPAGTITRYYDDRRHWISDGSSQSIAVDLTSEQMEGYINNLQSYKARMPATKPVPLPVGEDWQGLTDRLRGSALWQRAFMAAMQSIAANAAMTLMLASLTSTHSLQDLRFAFLTLRQVMQLTPALGDFSLQELDYLKTAMKECGFEPAIVDLG